MSNNTPVRPIAILTALALAAGCQLMLPALPVMADDASASHGCNAIYSALPNLTDEQRAKLQQIDQQWVETYQKLHPEIQQCQQDLKKQLANPKSDPTELMMLQKKLEDLKGQLKLEAMKCHVKKREVLNEEQQRLFQNMLQERIHKKRQEQTGMETPSTPIRWQRIWQNMQNIWQQDK